MSMIPPPGPRAGLPAELSFKAEDFASVGWKPGQEEHAAEIANRLLAERLGAAEIVYSCKAWEGYKSMTGNGKPCAYCKPARLVCIEKREGK